MARAAWAARARLLAQLKPFAAGGDAPAELLPEVCGHLRGFSSSDLREVLAAYAAHPRQASYFCLNSGQGATGKTVQFQDLVVQLLVGGSRLGSVEQLVAAGEALAGTGAQCDGPAKEFWPMFAERIKRACTSESIDGPQMARVFASCATWQRHCPAVVPNWGHALRTLGVHLAEKQHMELLSMAELVGLARHAAQLGEPQPKLAAAIGERVGRSEGMDRSGPDELNPQHLIDLIGAAGRLGGRLHMMTRALANRLEPQTPNLPSRALVQLCSHLGALAMFPVRLTAALEAVLTMRLQRQPLPSGDALQLLQACGRLRWRVPGILGPLLESLRSDLSQLDLLDARALGGIIYELYRLDLWDDVLVESTCARLRGPQLEDDGAAQGAGTLMLPQKTAANVLLALSYFSVRQPELQRRLVHELLRARDLPQEAVYQLKTFEMAVRLGHASVSFQDLGGLAARWLFSIRQAASTPEELSGSAFADEVSAVARGISWHHRPEVEVGPYLLDFAAVHGDPALQDIPEGWDESKPGRSLARFCVALEADGPTHFYRPHGRPWHWTSTSKLRHRLLSAMRIRVAHVPFYDWLQLEGLSQKEAYLTELLLQAQSREFPSLGQPGASEEKPSDSKSQKAATFVQRRAAARRAVARSEN